MMANKKTVDPDGLEASTKIVGVRLGNKHIEWIEELCKQRGCKRSVLIRSLIEREARDLYLPSPF
jgi:hypothetical protein